MPGLPSRLLLRLGCLEKGSFKDGTCESTGLAVGLGGVGRSVEDKFWDHWVWLFRFVNHVSRIRRTIVLLIVVDRWINLASIDCGNSIYIYAGSNATFHLCLHRSPALLREMLCSRESYPCVISASASLPCMHPRLCQLPCCPDLLTP